MIKLAPFFWAKSYLAQKVYQILVFLGKAGEVGEDVNIFADEPLQHRRNIDHHSVEVGHFWHQHLPAAKGQELASQRSSALRGDQDQFEVPPQAILPPQARQNKVGAAHDDGEQVIEIVGDAPGKMPHGFHLFGVDELIPGVRKLVVGLLQFLTQVGGPQCDCGMVR